MMITRRLPAGLRAAVRTAGASLASLPLLAGCVATTPATLHDCHEFGRRTFDITHVAVLPDGTLLAGGPSAQLGNCYAGVASGGWRPAVYRSNDRGQTWTGGTLPIDQEFVLHSDVLSLVAAGDGAVYAGVSTTRTTLGLEQVTQAWLMRSLDGGVSWRPVGHPASQAVVSSLAAGRGTRVFASICGRDGGLFRTDDGGGRWEFTGLHAATCDDVLYSDRAGIVLAYAAGDDGPGLYRSTDDGVTWSRLPLRTEYPVPHGVYRYIEGNGQGLVVFNTSIPAAYGPAPLYRSLDRGASWEPVETPVGQPVLALAVGPDARIFMTTAEELAWKPRAVFASGDAGATWETLPFFPFYATRDRNFAFGPDGTLYYGVFGATGTQPVGTFGGELRRSFDQGRTWEVLKVLPKSGER